MNLLKQRDRTTFLRLHRNSKRFRTSSQSEVNIYSLSNVEKKKNVCIWALSQSLHGCKVFIHILDDAYTFWYFRQIMPVNYFMLLPTSMHYDRSNVSILVCVQRLGETLKHNAHNDIYLISSGLTTVTRDWTHAFAKHSLYV